MTGKTFVDTNVLIYAHDVDAGSKHDIARRLLRELWIDRAGVLSPQVLQEFYVNVTRKIASPLSKAAARQVVHAYQSWCTEISFVEIETAFRIEDEARIGFWDALVIACAIKSGATLLLSEDLNPRQKIAGLITRNPFLAPGS